MKLKILFFSVMVLLVSACSKPVQMYAGPKQNNEILLRANLAEVMIEKVDGKATEGKFLEEDYHILAGRHSVTAKLHYEVWVGSMAFYVQSPIVKTICFNATNGKKYVALASSKRDNDDWDFYIREFDGKERVSFPCQ